MNTIPNAQAVSFNQRARVTTLLSADHRLWLLAILMLGILARLVFITLIDPRPSISGGDVSWYLMKGLQLVEGTLDSPVQTAPTFLVYVGWMQRLFPQDPVQAIRLLNIGWHALIIAAVYWLGVVGFSPGAGRVAALLVAISPAFIIEAGTPLTETLYMALLLVGLALAMRERLSPLGAGGVGVLLGLAALTRAVLLAFPILLAAWLVIWHGPRLGRRGAVRLAGGMLLAFGLTVSTWTAYNLARWNRFIIGAEGLTAFAWMGVTGTTDAHQIDAQIGAQGADPHRDQAFVQGFMGALLSDPLGWVARRGGNLAGAYLQPHNTVYFPGESLKDLAAAWWADDRSLGGLAALTTGDAFWPKLVLYGFHGWALGMGGLGMAMAVRRFWQKGPLYGFILYVSGVHFVLLALPRYLFPVEPLLYLFAAFSTLAIVARIRGKHGRFTGDSAGDAR